MKLNLISYPSVNFDDRPAGSKVKYLVYHYTAADLDLSLKLLAEPAENPVSSHYLICELGMVYQLVDEEKRAWHAGASAWGGDVNLNATSIGIELINPGHGPKYVAFSEAQMESLITLSKGLIKKYNISPFHILGHSDIAPTRKVDPGELFDWSRLAGEGIGVMPPAHLTVDDVAMDYLQECLRDFGYNLDISGVSDRHAEMIIKAFQMHYGGLDLLEVLARVEWLLDRKRSLETSAQDKHTK